MARDFDNTFTGNYLKTSSGALQQQVFFSRVLDQMVEALVYMDKDLVIRYANQPFYDLFGYEEGEIVGQNLRKLGIDDNFANLRPQEIARILHERKFWQGEVLRRAKDGHYIPVLVSAKVSYDDQGDFDGFVGTYMDLRPVRQSELRLRNGLTECITALAKAIEDRDLFKSLHHSRVNDLCVAIALDLDKDTTFIEGLSMAAILHDIGKVYIPSEILNFAGSLTDREMEVVKTHPAVGHDILKDIDLPWPVAEIVLQHHERLDGSGYPNRLQGDDILFGAKILAVADVVDSMHQGRPNRQGYGIDQCLEEIRKHRGVLYEPDVVDACLDIIREGRFTLDRD